MSYFNEDGLIKIIKYSSYIDVEKKCGFNNEENIWISYLGAGNISVMTLIKKDEKDEYLFKTRACEPKDSLGE